jgi:hypothetical protein
MKPTRYCLKSEEREWKYNGGGELVQGTLHTITYCMII